MSWRSRAYAAIEAAQGSASSEDRQSREAHETSFAVQQTRPYAAHPLKVRARSQAGSVVEVALESVELFVVVPYAEGVVAGYLFHVVSA